MTNTDRMVECGIHGAKAPAYVCSHLVEALRARDVRSIGFHEAEPEPDDDDLCGWCQACEEIRAEEGGWTDRSESFARIRLICSACFEDIRKLAYSTVS